MLFHIPEILNKVRGNQLVEDLKKGGGLWRLKIRAPGCQKA